MTPSMGGSEHKKVLPLQMKFGDNRSLWSGTSTLSSWKRIKQESKFKHPHHRRDDDVVAPPPLSWKTLLQNKPNPSTRVCFSLQKALENILETQTFKTCILSGGKSWKLSLKQKKTNKKDVIRLSPSQVIWKKWNTKVNMHKQVKIQRNS